MQGIIWAFLGTLFTFLVTCLGALNVFWIKKELSSHIQCIFLGFAGGVMIAASVWSLIIPGIDRAEELEQISWLVITIGFVLGVMLLLYLDYRLKKRMAGKTTRSIRTRLLVLAITVHNIPEGMAVGLAFAMAFHQIENVTLLSGAIALAVGIGIQNYPEGTAVALPLMAEGMSKKKAFIIGSLSAIVEPVFGVAAALVAVWIKLYMPVLLGFAAGAMIYVVVEELIPEAHECDKPNIGTLGFVLGFLVMMILDISLG